jgi:hypothetical protein
MKIYNMAGYTAAISLAEEKVRLADPERVAANTGASYDGDSYSVPWFGEMRRLSSGSGEVFPLGKPLASLTPDLFPISAEEKVLWLHYLLSEGIKEPSGKWIAYRDIAGARFYEPKVVERAVRPLVKKFGTAPERLIEAGKKLNGVPVDMGDCAIVLRPFPYIPIAYIIWAGDDELPAEGGILFDSAAGSRLCAEDYAVLASVGAYKLIKAV